MYVNCWQIVFVSQEIEHAILLCYVYDILAPHLIQPAAGPYSNAVDVYNSATGTWSTAQLSVARGNFAATSVRNVALFVGGAAASIV